MRKTDEENPKPSNPISTQHDSPYHKLSIHNSCNKRYMNIKLFCTLIIKS